MSNLETNIYNSVPILSVKTLDDKIESVTLRELFLNCGNYKDFKFKNKLDTMLIQHFVILMGRAFCKSINKYEFSSSSEMFCSMVNYLDKYSEHFQLAGPNYYFLQQNSHEKLMQKEKQSLTKLQAEVESGNNGNFFTKANDLQPHKHNLSETFFALLGGHLITYGGTGGGFKNETLNFTDTLASRALSVFIKKENLAETFFENIDIYNLLNNKINNLEGISLKPIWECSDHGQEMFAKFKSLTGAEAFQKFGYERLIKIFWNIDNETKQPYAQFATIAQGLVKSKDIEEFYPNIAITNNKDNEKIYLKPNKARAIWRDLDNILNRYSLIDRSQDENLYNTKFELEIYGIYSDKAKIEGTIRSIYYIPSEMITPINLNKLRHYLDIIEKNSRHLHAIFNNALTSIYNNEKKNIAVNAILNNTMALEEYWFYMGSYFTKFSILEKVIKFENFFEDELKGEIKKAKYRAANKFVQDYSNKFLKYKLIGVIYKDINYVTNK